MSQSVGYAVAALGPIAFGAVHSATGGWFWSLSMLLAVLLAQGVVGIFAGVAPPISPKSGTEIPYVYRQHELNIGFSGSKIGKQKKITVNLD
jgi:hypothetical protein